MTNDKIVSFSNPVFRDELTDPVRDGAQRIIRQAVEAELRTFVDEHRVDRDAEGRRAGVSTNDFDEALQALFDEALQALFGESVKGLSPTTIGRLKRVKCELLFSANKLSNSNSHPTGHGRSP